MTPLLSNKGLTKHFSGLVAVEDVDLTVQRNEVRALIGPNGAGKTTLVGMISGRIEPTRGTVRFDGKDITRLSAHRRMQMGMAYTFQITSIFPGLSVEENVALAVRVRLSDPEEVDRATKRALKRVGLEARMDQEAGDLSYGHQRLLEIAMGLAQAPKLLILDEPTQGLSEGEIEGFVALVGHLAHEASILLIEHNMRVVMEVAHRITVLNFGAVLAEGTPEEIRGNDAVQAAYLGTEHA
ncbi:MAG: ABC transporter ATP-binding protein [Pseudomonadota bacterium]